MPSAIKMVLSFDWIGGLLLGSVVASTDAASVFSVLREHSLSLRGGTDSLLEVESGSNDPVAYMLTAVLATLAAGGDINIPALLAKQIILGAGLGLAIGRDEQAEQEEDGHLCHLGEGVKEVRHLDLAGDVARTQHNACQVHG